LEIKFNIFAHIAFHDAILRVCWLIHGRFLSIHVRCCTYYVFLSPAALFFHFRKSDKFRTE